MRCPSLEELILYAAGDFEPLESAVADAHLAHCADCRERFEEARAVLDLLSNMARQTLSAGARRAVLAAAEELLPLEPAERRRRADKVERVEQVRRGTFQVSSAAASIAVFLMMKSAPVDLPEIPSSVQQRLEKILREKGTLTPGSAIQALAQRDGLEDKTNRI